MAGLTGGQAPAGWLESTLHEQPRPCSSRLGKRLPGTSRSGHDASNRAADGGTPLVRNIGLVFFIFYFHGGMNKITHDVE
jgi:hypothetical protein